MKELAVLDVAGHAGDMLGDAYEVLVDPVSLRPTLEKKLVSSIRPSL